ncbi:MAG: rhomboid family intramembrane serine protease [Phycisphaerales bacterium]
MLIPYSVDVPMRRYPLANWALIALTVIVGGIFIVDPEPLEPYLLLWRGDAFDPNQLPGHLLGHADWPHLFGNMLFLFVFGNAINARIGHLYFLLLYAVCGIIAGLVWLGLGTGPASLGASGAIMGLVGCFIVLYPRNDISVLYWFFIRFAGTFEISAYWIILMYVAFDLWGLFAGNDHGVNYLAHVAGFVTGFGIMTTLCATKLIPPDRAEQTLVDLCMRRNSARA